MKKYLLVMILAMTATAVHAEFNRLVFTTIDGESQSIGLVDLNITFADDQLMANSAGESVTMPLSSIKTMEFSYDTNGLEAITTSTKLEGKVTAYSESGQLQGTYDSLSIACSSLPSGVYILKAANGITSKILINK